MNVKEDDVSRFSRLVAVEKLNSVKMKLRRMKEDHYSLMVSLQLTQKESTWLRGDLKQKHVLTESLREVAKARKRDRERQRERARKSGETLAVRDSCGRMLLWLCADCVQSGIEVSNV